jgi:hypothetical protein
MDALIEQIRRHINTQSEEPAQLLEELKRRGDWLSYSYRTQLEEYLAQHGPDIF